MFCYCLKKLLNFIDDALAEKCPLNGLYTILQSNNAGAQLAFLNLQQDSASTNNEKCVGTNNNNENSFLMECADPTMIKFQLNKCSNVPSESIDKKN